MAVAAWLLAGLTALQAELYLIRANPGVTQAELERLVTDAAVGGRITERIIYTELGFIGVVADIPSVIGLRTLLASNQVRSEQLLLYQSGDIGLTSFEE